MLNPEGYLKVPPLPPVITLKHRSFKLCFYPLKIRRSPILEMKLSLYEMPNNVVVTCDT